MAKSSEKRSEFGHFYERPGRAGIYLRVRVDGKRRDLKAGKDMREARKFARLLEAELAAGRSNEPEIIERKMFDDFVEEFIEHRERVRAGTTVRRERTTVRNIIAPAFEGRWIDDITNFEVGRFIEKRMDVVGAGGRNRMVSLVSVMFKHAIRQGYLLTNPASGIERAREAKREFPWIERSTQDEMLLSVDDRLRDVATVALDTGMRKGELLRLTWSDVHFDRGRRGVVVIATSKTGRPRTVPMTSRVAAVLRRRKDARTIPLDGPDRVFWDAPKRSNHWGSSWSKRWKKGPASIGKPKMRFHDLRHLFCANLAREGVPISDIAKLAGHSMSMAMRYADHSPENSSELAIERLEGSTANEAGGRA